MTIQFCILVLYDFKKGILFSKQRDHHDIMSVLF